MNKRLLVAGSLRTLTRYKLRSFFMSLGIVIGVAALVVMRSMGTGTEQDMLDKIERMFGAGSILISNTGGGSHGGRRQPGKLTIADIEAIQDQLPQVIDFDPTLMIGNREVQYLDQNRGVMIVGHSERADPVWGRGVIEGKFFTEADLRSTARVALLGSKLAAELFGDEDPVGQQIQIGGSPFRVKGVLAQRAKPTT